MAQADYFLDIKGVDGESEDDDSKLKGKIHVTSFSFGVSNAGSGGINMGSGSGKSSLQDLHVTKVMDKSSPNLWLACCTGKHYDTACLIVRRAGDKPQTYLKYDMKEVFISSYASSGAEGGGIAQESVSLNFASVELTYYVQKADGTGTTAITRGWDIKKSATSSSG